MVYKPQELFYFSLTFFIFVDDEGWPFIGLSDFFKQEDWAYYERKPKDKKKIEGKDNCNLLRIKGQLCTMKKEKKGHSGECSYKITIPF